MLSPRYFDLKSNETTVTRSFSSGLNHCWCWKLWIPSSYISAVVLQLPCAGCAQVFLTKDEGWDAVGTLCLLFFSWFVFGLECWDFFLCFVVGFFFSNPLWQMLVPLKKKQPDSVLSTFEILDKSRLFKTYGCFWHKICIVVVSRSSHNIARDGRD